MTRVVRKNWEKLGVKDRLCEAQNHKCACCGKAMGATGHRGDYPTIEHVVPMRDGGADDVWNIAITCRECNERDVAQSSQESGVDDGERKRW